MRFALVCFALCAVLAAAFGAPAVSLAQAQCGFADAFDFPVDPAAFVLSQDFGAPSTRHQGRFHTGEDWYGGQGTSYGALVRAVADGRVTYASPNGWGVDGGVIIIEHTLRTDEIVYSMAGHLTDQTGAAFPAPFTCVRRGDVIGAIADARPAPHLHFEIRLNQPDVTGAGYTFESPLALGFRRPTKFILNFRARAADAFRYAADIADEAGAIAPPVALADGGLLALDANRVLGLSADLRVLWRVPLTRRAVGLVAAGPRGALIAYDDGGVQPIDADGTLGPARRTETPISGPPLADGARVLFATPTGGVAAFDSGMGARLWQAEAIGLPVRWAINDRVVVIIADDGRITTLDAASGARLDVAMLREPGAVAPGEGGAMLVYSRGGLWTIDGGGAWRLLREDTPPGGAGAAVVQAPDGTVYAFDGVALRAYPRSGPPLWEAALPGLDGTPALAWLPVDPDAPDGAGVVLLSTSAGHVVAVQPAGGGVCGQVRVYGDARSRLWHGLGADGLLRVHAADQVIGFGWRTLLGPCG